MRSIKDLTSSYVVWHMGHIEKNSKRHNARELFNWRNVSLLHPLLQSTTFLGFILYFIFKYLCMYFFFKMVDYVT